MKERGASAPKPPPDPWRALVNGLEETSDAGLLQYASDPVAFAVDVLGTKPWTKQEEILLAIRDHPLVTVRSSHGVGKTWTAAAALLWFIYSHQPSLVLSTAPTARQVESLLWSEVNRLWRKARQTLPGRCLNVRLQAGLGQEALGLTTTEPERFAGWHCEHLLVIVDEASGVPDSLFEVLHGTLTSAHCRLLLIGNPTKSHGQFHGSHRSEAWLKLKMSATDTPNFTPGWEVGGDPSDDKTSHPWLVMPSWVRARAKEWGEDSDPYRVRVLGEFPVMSSDALIALEWVESAQGRTIPPLSSQGGSHQAERVMGVDVARYGDCETVIAVREGDNLTAITSWQGQDLMATCGRILAEIRMRPVDRIVVDVVGLGAGLLDRLLELQSGDEARLLGNLEVHPFSSGERPTHDPDHCSSRRDEAYWALRGRLKDGEIAFACETGPLLGQLCALKYGFTSRGQVKIESKDDLRKRKVASPDWADAVALCFAPTTSGPVIPTAGSFERSTAVILPHLSGQDEQRRESRRVG